MGERGKHRYMLLAGLFQVRQPSRDRELTATETGFNLVW